MEVILLEDVKTLGKKGDKVNINDGYARNFVLPKKLGVEATPKNMNELKLQKASEEKRQQEMLDEAKAFAELIGKEPVVVKIKSGEGGRTFGSISSKEISIAAKTQHGLDIDKKKVQLSEPLKNLGTFTIPVKIHPKVTGELTVKVIEA